MTLLTVIWMIFKVIIAPSISIYLLNEFNLFSYITFIPEDKMFEVGLTAYLAVFETLFSFLEKIIRNQQAYISCVFYKDKTEENINNTPTIICNASTSHVANICCHIELSGNLNRLRKSQLSLKLPDWLSSQVLATDNVLKYNENTLYWNFDKLLPNEKNNKHTADCVIAIPFIQCADQERLQITLAPKQEKNWCKKFLVNFKTNSFKVCNKGDL